MTTGDDSTLRYIPGLTYPDREELTLRGLDHIRGFITNTDPGPDGGPGWLLAADPAATYSPFSQDWIDTGLGFWTCEDIASGLPAIPTACGESSGTGGESR